jgi:hypothetical protein
VNAHKNALAAAMLTALGIASAAANEIPEREHKGGAVMPCKPGRGQSGCAESAGTLIVGPGQT